MGSPQFVGYGVVQASALDEMNDIWPRVREWRGVQIDDTAQPPTATRDHVARLNFDINRQITYRLESQWQSPVETWSLRTGDCKDYATLKRAILLQRGWVDEEDVAIVIGEIRAMPRNLPHAWCAARVGGEWFVLDNKFDQLIAPQEYINWTPIKACCVNDVVLYLRLGAIELSRAQ